jgi:hypothetical protein
LEVWVVLSKISNEGLALEIPDLDRRVGGSAEPVSSWGEDKGVDDITSLKRVQVLSFVEVPQSDSTVLATRSAKRTVRRDGNGIDVSRVSSKVGLKLAGLEIPYLDVLVPASRYNGWVLSVWRETDAANPFSVSLIFDGVLALSKSVPELDGSVSRSRDDLSVVSREGNTQNILGVSNKTSGGSTKVQIPETKSTVP